MPGPLQGIRVLDLTIFQNGGWATMMLADMGADVIKVELPGSGDPGRAMLINQRLGKDGPTDFFEIMNRGKKSITLDLRKPAGLDLFYRLVPRFDVVTQNFRVGVAERLGVDYETLRKHNERIVFACSSGFGPEGPDASQPLYDIVGQARSGLMDLFSDPSQPMRYIGGFGIADQMGAIGFAYAILLALVARERLGVGQQVDVSQLGSLMLLQGLPLNCAALTGHQPNKVPRTAVHNPLSNIYQAGDGRWLALGCTDPQRYWPAFCQVLGIDQLRDDPMFATRDLRRQNCRELISTLDEVFRTRLRDEWVRSLAARDVICQAVQDYRELLVDPQVRANDYLFEYETAAGPSKAVGPIFRLSATPAPTPRRSPDLGEHTSEVLAEVGCGPEEIEHLRAKGVV